MFTKQPLNVNVVVYSLVSVYIYSHSTLHLHPGLGFRTIHTSYLSQFPQGIQCSHYKPTSSQVPITPGWREGQYRLTSCPRMLSQMKHSASPGIEPTTLGLWIQHPTNWATRDPSVTLVLLETLVLPLKAVLVFISPVSTWYSLNHV